jgi:hypothetical protein
MRLKETIKKVLKEEEKRSLAKLIKNLVDDLLMNIDPDRDYVCSYELFEPTFGGKKMYKIIVTFISGPSGENWPRTQAVKVREEEILNEIQDYILNYFQVYVTMFSRITYSCE